MPPRDGRSAITNLTRRLTLEHLESREVPALAVSATQSSTALLSTLLGPNVVASNVTLVSNYNAAADRTSTGTFTGGRDDGVNSIGIASGIVLSTGGVQRVTDDTNITASYSYNTGTDTDLNASIPNNYRDTSSLKFDFVAVGNRLRVNYVFAFDEGPGTVVDAFAFLIKDVTAGATSYTNIAKIPGSNDSVTVGRIRPDLNSQYYRSNSGAIGIIYDHLSTVLTADTALTPGHTYTVKFVIGDYETTFIDSTVFVQASSFVATPQTLNTGTVSAAYSAQVLGTAPVTSPTSYTLSPGSSTPPGLSLNATTGTLVGTPTQPGTYKFYVDIANGTDFAQVVVNMTVRPSPASPLPTSQKSPVVLPTIDSSGNGVVRVLNTNGTTRFAFAPYGSLTERVAVVAADVTHDGAVDVVTAARGVVSLFDGRTGQRLDFRPFGGFAGQMRLGAGDLNGDGVPELVVSAAQNGITLVIDGSTYRTLALFSAVATTQSTVELAFGDLNGDHQVELIASAHVGNSLIVNSYDFVKMTQVDSITLPAPGGDRFALAVSSHNGHDDLVIATGGIVAVLNPQSRQVRGLFDVFGRGFAGDTRLETIGDDILAVSEFGGRPVVKRFDGETLGVLDIYFGDTR